MGIGGSGASAIASIAQAQGYEVSGCDRVPPLNDFTRHFDQSLLFEGHSPAHLEVTRHSRPDRESAGMSQTDPRFRKDDVTSDNSNDYKVDILAISPAITSLDPDNAELNAAKEQGIEVMTWQEFMGKYLEQDKFVIAICGTHGKSTTTAMIAHVLEEAGLDPTVEVGAVVGKWGRNYRIGKNVIPAKAGIRSDKPQQTDPRFRKDDALTKPIFVTEADEFNENFLVSHPDITVLNNLDMDHPEYYKDFEAYTDAFDKFLMQTKGTIVANLEDKNVAELLKWTMKHTGVTCIDFNKNEIQLDLKVIGEYNKKNALAAFQVGLLLNIEPQQIISALNSFTGIGRRQELLGEVNGAKIYSDYAHHPKEIEVTAEAFRTEFPDKKITIIFQPHMFTRTKALFKEFVEVFKTIDVNRVVINDIFQAREKDPGDMKTQMIIDAVDKKSVTYVPTTAESIEKINDDLDDNDIVIVMGAAVLNDEIARKWVNPSSRR